MLMPDIYIGKMARLTRIVDIGDFNKFSELSGDKNPIHANEEFACKTKFRSRIAPGFLIGSYISALIANELPGPGSIYISQNLTFCRPVFPGDLIEVRVEVIDIVRPGVCRLSTVCDRGNGECVIEGEAIVKFPT
jgi:3-hydroxybutyryl-CoA dehydratase